MKPIGRWNRGLSSLLTPTHVSSCRRPDVRVRPGELPGPHDRDQQRVHERVRAGHGPRALPARRVRTVSESEGPNGGEEKNIYIFAFAFLMLIISPILQLRRLRADEPVR